MQAQNNNQPVKRSDAENKAIYELALKGLRLLSKLTALVTEMVRFTSTVDRYTQSSETLVRSMWLRWLG